MQLVFKKQLIVLLLSTALQFELDECGLSIEMAFEGGKKQEEGKEGNSEGMMTCFPTPILL